MSTSETRYILLLRNPTDRAVSYLFHWHRGKLVYNHLNHTQFTAKIVHAEMVNRSTELGQCMTELNELQCFYKCVGRDGDMNCLLRNSLYIIILEEAFRFIPRDRVLIMDMADYSRDEIGHVEKITRHFQIPMRKNAGLDKHIYNKGRKNAVWPETIAMLDKLFMPYNKRLAVFLGDNKWLYNREDKQS